MSTSALGQSQQGGGGGSDDDDSVNDLDEAAIWEQIRKQQEAEEAERNKPSPDKVRGPEGGLSRALPRRISQSLEGQGGRWPFLSHVHKLCMAQPLDPCSSWFTQRATIAALGPHLAHHVLQALPP